MLCKRAPEFTSLIESLSYDQYLPPDTSSQTGNAGLISEPVLFSQPGRKESWILGPPAPTSVSPRAPCD